MEPIRNTDQRVVDLRAVRQADVVELLGTTRASLRIWESEGLPASRHGKAVTYDLFRLLPWLKRRWVTGSEPGSKSKHAAEVELLVARRVHLELKTRIANGEFKPRDLIERESTQKVVSIRAGLEALQRQIAPAILELPSEATVEDAEKLVWEYVEPLLLAFAGQRPARRHHAKKRNDPIGDTASRDSG